MKKQESRYEAGARNFNWVKLKRHSAGALNDTIDCVLLGYLYGRGKRAALGAGSLLVGLYDPEQDQFVTVTKIGTGLSDEQWRSIRERTKGLEVDHRPARVSSLIEPSVWVRAAAGPGGAGRRDHALAHPYGRKSRRRAGLCAALSAAGLLPGARQAAGGCDDGSGTDRTVPKPGQEISGGSSSFASD